MDAVPCGAIERADGGRAERHRETKKLDVARDVKDQNRSSAAQHDATARVDVTERADGLEQHFELLGRRSDRYEPRRRRRSARADAIAFGVAAGANHDLPVPNGEHRIRSNRKPVRCFFFRVQK